MYEFILQFTHDAAKVITHTQKMKEKQKSVNLQPFQIFHLEKLFYALHAHSSPHHYATSNITITLYKLIWLFPLEFYIVQQSN